MRHATTAQATSARNAVRLKFFCAENGYGRKLGQALRRNSVSRSVAIELSLTSETRYCCYQFSDSSSNELKKFCGRPGFPFGRLVPASRGDFLVVPIHKSSLRGTQPRGTKGRLRCGERIRGHLSSVHHCGVQVIGSERLGVIAVYHHLHKSPSSADCAGRFGCSSGSFGRTPRGIKQV
jgi:hypothetical protein